MFDIDLLSFAGNVALADSSDPVKAHAMVYSHPLTPHLRGTDGDDAQARMLRKRASDAYFSTLYFPYFSVKPLYILAMEAAHKAGASVIDSSRIISALSFLGIALAVWFYTRSPLAIVILILPETMVLGLANEPDGMSTMLLLFGLTAIFLKQVNLGILPLIVAVWVRPDNAILCVMVLGFLWLSGKLEWRNAVVLVALTAASEIVISHFGYGWRSLYSHTFLGADPGEIPRFTSVDYLHALVRGTMDALHSSLPVYAILWAVCLIQIRDRGLRQTLWIAALFSLARFVMFPNYEPRYYGLYFIVTAGAAIHLIAGRSSWKTPMSVAHR